MIYISGKTKLIVTVMIISILAVTLVTLYYYRREQETLNVTDMHMTEKNKEFSDKSSVNELFTDRQVLGNTNSKLMNNKENSQNDNRLNNQTNRGDIVSIEPNSDVSTREETSIKVLKKYNEIINSPEFMAESHDILFDSKITQIKFEEKIKDLENKEKELEHSLITASVDGRSDIENDLKKIRNELWETNVELAKEVILADDAYQKLKLRHITVDEIRLVQQEISKKTHPFLSTGNNEQINLAINEEAIRRLKASGWTPNPLRSYQ